MLQLALSDCTWAPLQLVLPNHGLFTGFPASELGFFFSTLRRGLGLFLRHFFIVFPPQKSELGILQWKQQFEHVYDQDRLRRV